MKLEAENMNPVARKTMIILLKILEMKEFTQMAIINEIVKTGREELTASAAQINRVVRWLTQHGYIIIKRRGNLREDRIEDRISHGLELLKPLEIEGRIFYELINPLGVLELIALHRSMASIKKDTFRVSIKKSELIEFLKSRDVVFCLGTALEIYSGYYRPDEISFYAKEDNKMRDYLKSHPGNLLTVSWYDPPDRVLKNGNYTTEVQTAVDMFCDGKGYYAKDILHKLWGIIVD